MMNATMQGAVTCVLYVEKWVEITIYGISVYFGLTLIVLDGTQLAIVYAICVDHHCPLADHRCQLMFTVMIKAIFFFVISIAPK